MVDYQKVRSIAEAEKLTMRIWVLNSQLDTEETYLQYLDTLLLVSTEVNFKCTLSRKFDRLR